MYVLCNNRKDESKEEKIKKKNKAHRQKENKRWKVTQRKRQRERKKRKIKIIDLRKKGRSVKERGRETGKI